MQILCSRTNLQLLITALATEELLRDLFRCFAWAQSAKGVEVLGTPFVPSAQF